MDVLHLSVDSAPAGPLAHPSGMHGWYARAVTDHRWVWPLLRRVGANEIRLTRIFQNGDVGFARALAALDVLVLAGYTPHIVLNAMPAELARDPNAPHARGGGTDGPPRSLEEWQAHVVSFLEALLARYGPATVGSCILSYWDEPDAYWRGTWGELWALYAATAAAVASFEATHGLSLQLGGGDIYIGRTGMWAGFLSRVQAGLRCDFITAHYYAGGPAGPTGSVAGFAAQLLPMLDEHGLAGKPLQITEWGADGRGMWPGLDDGRGACWALDTLYQIGAGGYDLWQWYCSAAYGLGIGEPEGRLGLWCVTGARQARPQEGAMEAWSWLGRERHAVLGLAGDVRAVADEAGNILAWNAGDTVVLVLAYGRAHVLRGWDWLFLAPPAA